VVHGFWVLHFLFFTFFCPMMGSLQHAIAVANRIGLVHLQHVFCADTQPWRTPSCPTQPPSFSSEPLTYLLPFHFQCGVEELCWRYAVCQQHESPHKQFSRLSGGRQFNEGPRLLDNGSRTGTHQIRHILSKWACCLRWFLLFCRRNLDAIFKEGGTLRLQFPREDLGFIYGPGAPSSLSTADSLLAASGRNSQFVPRLSVGGRLPHARLRWCCTCCHTPGQPLAHTNTHQSRDGDVALQPTNHVSQELTTVDLPGHWPGHVVLLLLSDQAHKVAQSHGMWNLGSIPTVIVYVARGRCACTVIQHSRMACHVNGFKAFECACGHSTAQAGTVLGVNEEMLHMWLRDERGEMEALQGVAGGAVDVVVVRPDGHISCLGDVEMLKGLLAKGVHAPDLV
jgi:hypothetical protein